MGKLANPGYISRLLSRHAIQLKKKWGQNFLADDHILEKIAGAAELTGEDLVLEVGPGIGGLTEKLAERAGQVIALEIDGRLIPVLQETLGSYTNIELVQADALKIDYASLLARPAKLVANLPYNVATPLIYRWLKEYRSCFTLFVFMVQREVALRIIAPPGGKEYGVLSVVTRFAAEAELLFTVPRTVFFPRPEVFSAVVRLRPRRQPIYEVGDEALFYRLVEAVFAQRRKTLLNTLHAAFALEKEELAQLGRARGIDMNRRGETLGIDEFAILSRLIYNRTGGQ